jgi:hypothetical protein
VAADLKYYAESVYMWTSAHLSVEIDVVDGREVILIVGTPVGPISIIGTVTVTADVLELDGVHVSGSGPGRLGRDGINAIARRIMEELDVQEIRAQGGVRTTGRRSGQVPRPFRFVRHD